MAAIKQTTIHTPQAIVEDGVIWTGGASVTISDDIRAVCTVGATSTTFLELSDFGFTQKELPLRAKIVGLNIHAEGYGIDVDAADRVLRFQFAEGNPAVLLGTRGTLTFGTVEAVFIRANSQDLNPLWSWEPTPPRIHSPNFTVKISTDTGTPTVPATERYLDFVGVSVLFTDPDEGYRFAPQVRCVPDNGAEETLDLAALLTDMSGPTKTDAKYMIEQEKRVTVNRNALVTQFGLRAEIVLTLEIMTMADAAVYSTLVSRSISPEWKLYLSMDAGVTEREVFVSKIDGPDPLGKKTFAGARFVLGFTTIETFDEMPNFGGIGFGLGNW